MSVLFVNDAKILLTTAVDPQGNVNITDLNSLNTFEIPILKDSLNFTVQESSSYVDVSNGIKNLQILEAYSNTTTGLVSLNFSTYINAHQTTGLPVDQILWEALSRSELDLELGFSLLSTNKLIKYFGVLLLFKGKTYVFNNCFVDGNNISMDLSGFNLSAWNLSALNLTQIDSVVADSGNLNGAVTGSYTVYNQQAYRISAGKLLLITLMSYTGDAYTLASRSCAVSVSNEFQFINSGTAMTSTVTRPKLAGYLGSKCTANTSFYLKGDALRLFEEQVYPYIGAVRKPQYKCVIQGVSTTGNPLFNLTLENTVVDFKLGVSKQLEGSMQLKVVEGDSAMNSAVKFYN